MTNLRYLEKIFPGKFNIDTLRYRHDFPIPIVFAKIVGPGRRAVSTNVMEAPRDLEFEVGGN